MLFYKGSQPGQGCVQQTYCVLVLMMFGEQLTVIDELKYLQGSHTTVSLLLIILRLPDPRPLHHFTLYHFRHRLEDLMIADASLENTNYLE